MNKSVQWIKLWVVIGIIVLVIPLIIDRAYFYGPSEPNVSLSESDALGYCGTILAVITSAIVAVLLKMQSREIADNQAAIAKHQLKIDLFDKRYAVYECFLKHYKYGKFLITEEECFCAEAKRDLVSESIIDSLSPDGFSIGKSSADFEKQKSLRERLEAADPDSENEKALKNELETLQCKLRQKKCMCWKRDTSIVAMAEFCYDSTIAPIIKDYVDVFFQSIMCDEKHMEAWYYQIKEMIPQIENKVLDEMKEQLNLSVVDIQKNG